MGKFLKSGKLGTFTPKTYSTNIQYSDITIRDALIKTRNARNNLTFLKILETDYKLSSKDSGTVYMIYDKFVPSGPIPSGPSIDIDMPPAPPPQADSWVLYDDGAPTPRFSHNSFGYNGEIYIIFGRVSDIAMADSIEAFSLSTHTWRHVADVPSEYSRTNSTILLYNAVLYIIGGLNSQSSPIGYMDSYSLISNTFSHVVPLPVALYDATAYFDKANPSIISYVGGQGDIPDEHGVLVYNSSYNIDIANIASGWVKGELNSRKIQSGYAKAKCGTEIIVGSSNFIVDGADESVFADRIKLLVRKKDDIVWSSETHNDFDWGTCSNIGIYDDLIIFTHTNENPTLTKTKQIAFDQETGNILSITEFDEFNSPRSGFNMIGFNNEIFITCGFSDAGVISSIEQYCKPRPPAPDGDMEVEYE